MSGYLDGMPSVARAPKSTDLAPAAPSRGTKAKPARKTTVVVPSASDALHELGELERSIRALEVRRVRLIGTAQRHGASWEDIGSALEVSRQAAWEKYRRRVRATLNLTADRAGHSETETLESAARVLKEVRARRRRR